MSDIDPMRKNMSFLNPMDLALMKKEGQFSPDMTVRDAIDKALKMAGINPDGPVEQLNEMLVKQTQNADMVGKMQNIAADSQTPEEGVPVPQAEETTPGLEGLLRR